jgi:murein DD-endopeptidase MepM/ murein hydrolase activator NlpD
MSLARFRAPAWGFALALVACEEVEVVQDRFRDLTPYEAYRESLADAGLAETALGRDWIRAGADAVVAAVPISPPFQEEGYITAETPGAMAYRITVPRGRRLTAHVTLDSEEGTRVFVDLFRVPEDAEDPPRPIISTDSVPGSFVHEPFREGDFILRLQPELLRGGQYRVILRLEAQLAFPVDGRNMPAIQSVFGAERDGGARSHDGVDIFAPRGTPVLAAAPGVAFRVGITGLGGKVVWVRDPLRNARLYYAHLDSQHVRNGDRIQVGDTLGFVGNTGNARTTPPHLHFGLYRTGEGPIDPTPFLRPVVGTLADLTADVDRLGAWVRLGSGGVHLRAAPERDAPVLRDLPQFAPARVLGGSADFFRVRLPDGVVGYVAAALTEPLDEPLASQVARVAADVRAQPREDAPIVASLDGGAPLPVHGWFDGYLYVATPGGRLGWLAGDLRTATLEQE